MAFLEDLEGLTAHQIQKIARDFNISESSFVFSKWSKITKKVRIFTLSEEIHFAGHPSIGSAFIQPSEVLIQEFNKK